MSNRPSCGRLNVRRLGAAVTASVLAIGALAPPVASAQETGSQAAESITGGALLGSEVGTLVESLAGVHSPWVYAITDVALAGGGAIGGYEVQDHSSNGQISVFTLAVGLGLLIPAVILTWNATTQYLPSEDASGTHPPSTGPAAAPATGTPPPPAPGGERAPSSASGVSAAHRSLLDVSGAALHLGLPIPDLRPTFSANELRQYGLAQQTEVRMSLVKVAF